MADSTPDLSTWLTKEQAAAALGVATKTIERMAQRGLVQQALWKRPGLPVLAVYEPDDVARLAKDRDPGPLPAFVLPAPGNGNGHGLVPADAGIKNIPGEDLLRALVTAALRVVSETSETPAPMALFLTLEQAAAYCGLSETYLRRQIAAGALKAVKDRGWRIRRADLDEL